MELPYLGREGELYIILWGMTVVIILDFADIIGKALSIADFRTYPTAIRLRGLGKLTHLRGMVRRHIRRVNG